MPALSTSTYNDAADLADRVLVVPVGATEQHGPHLPLTTDTDIACGLAERLLVAAPDAVVVAPAVAFGSSGEHQEFAGTLSVGQEAIERFLVELGRSATCTWRRLLFLSTHGGNVRPVTRAVSRLKHEGRDVCSWMPSWGGDAHAGHIETSIMLVLARDAVDVDSRAVGATEPLARLMPRLVTEGVAAVSENGILGDATTASAAEGEALLQGAVESLRTTIALWPLAGATR